MSADSAIMNPSKLISLFLRGKWNRMKWKIIYFWFHSIKCTSFNIDTKAKIASVQIGSEIIFWNWIDQKTLLLVSESAAYRWEYEQQDSIPIKWFDKSAVLNDSQIINASNRQLGNWCFLSGISLKVSFEVENIYWNFFLYRTEKSKEEFNFTTKKKKSAKLLMDMPETSFLWPLLELLLMNLI